MNKLLFLFILLLSFQAQAQVEWEINETDEFTGARKLIGKWEKINPFGGNYTYVRFGVIDELFFLGFKNCLDEVSSVDRGDKVYFKFENEEILEFEQSEYQITSEGAGSINMMGSETQGFHFTFPLDKEELKLFAEYDIYKWRYVTNSGYVESKTRKKTDYVRLYAKFFFNNYEKINSN